MKPRMFVLLLAVLALLCRLYCSWTTIGTPDVSSFWKFAHVIRKDGLLEMYQKTVFFNHTPLVGWFAQGALALSVESKVENQVIKEVESPRLFAFYLRLPAVFADLFAVLALVAWRQKSGKPAWWALAVYAASPVAFMVSGYHGNVDSIMTFAVLLAALACAQERPAVCGFCLGLACNIKIIPLLLIPAFFFLWLHRGNARRFSLPLLLMVLIGWSYPLLTIPGVFLKNVLGYSGFCGVWGITYLLRIGGVPGWSGMSFTDPTDSQAFVIQAMKLVVILMALMLGWVRRKEEPAGIFRTLALIWAVFFTFAPGFGAQYLAWLAPFFLVANERWYAAITVTSSVALFVFYTAISTKIPWYQAFAVHTIASQWAGWLVLPWITLAAYLASEVRTATRPKAGEPMAA